MDLAAPPKEMRARDEEDRRRDVVRLTRVVEHHVGRRG
jgi:hypothetical protein